MSFLHNYSDVFNLFFFCFVLCLGGTFLFFLIKALDSKFKYASELAFYNQGALLGVFIMLSGFVLTLSLVSELNDKNKINLQITNEIAFINDIDRTLAAFCTPEMQLIRSQLGQYTQSIIVDEWPVMSLGRGNEATRLLFDEMSKNILALRKQGKINLDATDILNPLIKELSLSRYHRISLGNAQLPKIFWLAMLVLISISAIIFYHISDKKITNLFLSYMLLSCLGVLMGLTYVIDEPFVGESSIKPDGYIAVQAIISSRQCQ